MDRDNDKEEKKILSIDFWTEVIDCNYDFKVKKDESKFLNDFLLPEIFYKFNQK